MEWALLAVVVVLAALGAFWVWHAAGAEQRAEAYKGQNGALDAAVRAKDAALVEAAEGRLEEDKHRVETARTSAALRDELRLAAARAKSSNSN